jgi:GTPase SAR1 family protein
MEEEFHLKLIIVGDTGVGKSSIITRYIDGEFNPNMVGTAGIDHKMKNIQHQNRTIKV